MTHAFLGRVARLLSFTASDVVGAFRPGTMEKQSIALGALMAIGICCIAPGDTQAQTPQWPRDPFYWTGCKQNSPIEGQGYDCTKAPIDQYPWTYQITYPQLLTISGSTPEEARDNLIAYSNAYQASLGPVSDYPYRYRVDAARPMCGRKWTPNAFVSTPTGVDTTKIAYNTLCQWEQIDIRFNPPIVVNTSTDYTAFFFSQITSCPAGWEPRGSQAPNFEDFPAICYSKTSPKESGGQCPNCGNPISIASGNKYQVETDDAGRLPIVRYYNSFGAMPSISLGNNWRLGYDRRVMFDGNVSAMVTRPDGKALLFLLVSGAWVSESDVNDRLTSMPGGGWQYYAAKGDDVEAYDGQGKLTSITSRSGEVTTFDYSDASTPPAIAPNAGMLIRVTGQFGHALNLSYNAQGRLISIGTPAGTSYNYVQDANGNLASVTNPDGTTKTYAYAEAANSPAPQNVWALTGINDENGARFATYQYNAAGRAISTEHAGGVNHFVVGTGSPVVTTDPLGTSRSYTLSSIFGVRYPTQISQPCGTPGCTGTVSETRSYDANGNIASKTDFNGNKVCYSYDLARNLETTRVEGLTSGALCTTALSGTPAVPARRIDTTWHPTFRIPATITEPTTSGNKVTSFTHDANGNVLTRSVSVGGQARTWTYTYDAYGRVLTATDPRGKTSTNTYYPNTAAQNTANPNSRGMLATVTNAAGHTTSITAYNAHGQPLSITDPNGLTTSLTYDARQRLTQRNVGGETTVYDYDGVGQLTKVTLPDGSFLQYTYDAAHRLIEIKDSLNHRIVYTLDAMGNRTQEDTRDPANALARTRSRVIDALNRLQRDIGGASAGQVTQYAYDNNGNLTGSTDPLSRTTTHQYDALNRLINVIDPVNGAGAPTKYDYDAQDNLTQVTDPKNLATTYTYNGFNELTSQVSPDTGTTGFTYDNAGNLQTKTDARGVTVTYGYDSLNRVISIGYPAYTNPGSGITDPAETVTYTYDTCPNGKGRLCSLTDKTGSTAYSYDQKGRITAKSQTVAGLTQTVAYRYNAAGQMDQVTYPSGAVVGYGYANNRIVSVSVNGNTVLSGVDYEPFGPVGEWTWGNHTAMNPNRHTRYFDLDGRIGKIESATSLDATQYAYDLASRITGIDTLTVGTGTVNPAKSAGYGYDNLDRLVSQTPGAGNTAATLGYSYDAIGNRLSQTTNGAATSYSYPATNHRLTSLTGATAKAYTYDAVGNTLTDGTATWNYGGNNRPISISVPATSTTPATVVQTGINALGQRVTKSVNGILTRFVYDEAGRLIGEYEGSGQLKSEHVWLNDLPVALVRPQAATPTEQIIDNTAAAPAFTVTGPWSASTAVAGFLGSNYLAHAPGNDAPGAVIVDNTDVGFSVTGTWPASSIVGGHVGADYRTHEPNGEPPAGILIDNGSPGTAATGPWPASTAVSGYAGTNYQTQPAGTGANSYTWSATLPNAGYWRVYARWTAHANRANNAPYAIATSTGNQTIPVNQQANGGTWNLLGTFNLTTTPSITLTDQANGYVVADAVLFVPEGASPNSATWTATLPNPGSYRVYARWTSHANRATNAAYAITTSTGNQTISVNQATGGGTWNLLGTFNLTTTPSLSLTDQANGYVVADAVKFEAEGSLPESAVWKPAVTTPASYDVSARWTQHANRAAQAKYIVTHQAGQTTVTVDQRANGGTWNNLGTFTFTNSAGQGVRLEAAGLGYVVADGVRFAQSATQPGGGSGVYYVHADQLGTPRAITKASDNAKVWEWKNDDPFGANAPTENPSGLGNFEFNLGFPGQYRDKETGTAYNYFRDYDPATGRYGQSDPIGLVGGINTYAYVAGSPLSKTDRLGLDPFDGGSGGSTRPYVPGPLDILIPGTPANNQFVESVKRVIKAIKDACTEDESDCTMASEYQLQQAGITDAHAFKEEYVGKQVSRYDICACKDGSIKIAARGQCGKPGPKISTWGRWKR